MSQLQTEDATEKEQVREHSVWNLGLTTPIRFYGKVVDENANPVDKANVHISLHDRGVGNTKVEQVTDAKGLFSVSGRGLGLGVMVSKQGYYHLPESDGSFGYAKGAGMGNPHPDSNDPAVFILRKMGESEMLYKFERDFRIPKDGTPITVDLSTGRRSNDMKAAITVQAWTQESAQRPFTWRYRITSFDGGVLESAGEFDFIAPENGYQTSVEFNMPFNIGREWRSQVSKRYFVKLAEGNYARIDFTMTAGGDHFFSLSSYFNPKPGNRNLEFDPAKQVDAIRSAGQ